MIMYRKHVISFCFLQGIGVRKFCKRAMGHIIQYVNKPIEKER